jgi:hypothetical protein
MVHSAQPALVQHEYRRCPKGSGLGQMAGHLVHQSLPKGTERSPNGTKPSFLSVSASPFALRLAVCLTRCPARAPRRPVTTTDSSRRGHLWRRFARGAAVTHCAASTMTHAGRNSSWRAHGNCVVPRAARSTWASVVVCSYFRSITQTGRNKN